jgi:hypothetical protein
MIVASRSLTLRRQEASVVVEVRIFAPQSDQGHWSCAYEIDWPQGTRKFAAHGLDSMQALILALNMIGSEIYTSEYHKAGDLSSDASRKGYGFPVPQNLRDLLQGDDAKYF